MHDYKHGVSNTISQILPLSPELVDADFTLEVELYCSLPADDLSAKSSTPIKMLKKLRHRVCRTWNYPM